MILVKFILIIVALCLFHLIEVMFREKDNIGVDFSPEERSLVPKVMTAITVIFGVAIIVLITVAIMI